jgi:hypothetical protein
LLHWSSEQSCRCLNLGLLRCVNWRTISSILAWQESAWGERYRRRECAAGCWLRRSCGSWLCGRCRCLRRGRSTGKGEDGQVGTLNQFADHACLQMQHFLLWVAGQTDLLHSVL